MSSEENGRVRILVDHSGYALLNIGDIAMLQACVHRLWRLWPEAEIDVFTQSPERLARFCPGTNPVASTILGRGRAAALPESSQLAAEQMWKIFAPLLDRSRRVTGSSLVRQQEAVRRADMVVSSGGGFVNDVFWWHGAGVLSVLAMAQRLDKPTAMFGQGVGPLTHPLLRRLVKRTMPRLDIVGLREGTQSLPLLHVHHVAPERIHVTGDDALLLATPASRPPTASAVGLNVRVASYSRMAESMGGQVVATTRRAAADRGVPTVALPVENNKNVSDLQAMRVEGTDPDDVAAASEFSGLHAPHELAQRVSRCRVVVTGSYHAAVFGLAAGIPAVCVTNSAYYDGKFLGLAALFRDGCHLVRPGPRFEQELSAAIDRAWATSEAGRDAIHCAALAQVDRADGAYQLFKAIATRRSGEPSSGAASLYADEPTIKDTP